MGIEPSVFNAFRILQASVHSNPHLEQPFRVVVVTQRARKRTKRTPISAIPTYLVRNDLSHKPATACSTKATGLAPEPWLTGFPGPQKHSEEDSETRPAWRHVRGRTISALKLQPSVTMDESKSREVGNSLNALE